MLRRNIPPSLILAALLAYSLLGGPAGALLAPAALSLAALWPALSAKTGPTRQDWLGLAGLLLAFYITAGDYAPRSLLDPQWPFYLILLGLMLSQAAARSPLDWLYGLYALGTAFYLWAIHLSPNTLTPPPLPLASWALVAALLYGRAALPDKLPAAPALGLLGLLLAFGLAEGALRNDFLRREALGGYPVTVFPEYTLARQHLGAEDMPYPPQVPPEKRRVLLLGDSFTYGYGVLPEDRYPAVLASYAPSTLEVVVLAKPAANTVHQLSYWRAYGREAGAGVVMVGVVINDPEMGQLTGEPPPGPLRIWLPRSQFAYFLERQKPWELKWLQTPPPYDPWEASLYPPLNANWEVWENTVQLLYDEITATGAEAWAVILIRPDDLENAEGRAFWAGAYQQLAASYAEAGFYTLNLWGDYVAQFGGRDHGDLCAFPNDCHPNAEVHRFYADAVWRALLAGP
jgi:lysophospholipase L1-like esterase